MCTARGKAGARMMQCPECGNRDGLRVSATFQGTVDISCDDDGDFEVVDSDSGDSEWEDESQVECLDCCHVTTVKEAEASFEKGPIEDDEEEELTA